MKRILILDDDLRLLQNIVDFFKTEPYLVDKTSSIRRAKDLFASSAFDLFISEREISGVDCLPWLKEVRQRCSSMRILICSRCRMVEQRVEALRLSDDFLAKPFNLLELSLRVGNLLAAERKILAMRDSASAWCEQKQTLRPQEMRILQCLWHHRNMVVSYENLLSYVWGMKEPLPSALSVSVYIRRIRMKLGPQARCIQTISGRGYRLFIED
jgi:DNA-binding response OmpR family regulator